MRCGVTREWISRSLDGRLDKESSATLAEHLAACADCRTQDALLRGSSTALRSVGRAQPPAGLARRATLAAFNAQREGKSARATSWWSELVRFAMPAAAVSAVAAAALLIVASVRGAPDVTPDGAGDPAAAISIDRGAFAGRSLSRALGEEVD